MLTKLYYVDATRPDSEETTRITVYYYLGYYQIYHIYSRDPMHYIRSTTPAQGT